MNSNSRVWLSFADPSLPDGSQFLGVAIVRGVDVVSAVVSAHALNINPGGEVMCVEIPDDMLGRIPPYYFDRLLSRAECEEFDRVMMRRDSHGVH